MNKLQAAEQLRRALQMFAQTLTDEQAHGGCCCVPGMGGRQGLRPG